MTGKSSRRYGNRRRPMTERERVEQLNAIHEFYARAIGKPAKKIPLPAKNETRRKG